MAMFWFLFVLFCFYFCTLDGQFTIPENKSYLKRERTIWLAPGLRRSGTLTSLKGTAVLWQDSNSSQRFSEPFESEQVAPLLSEALYCSLDLVVSLSKHHEG